MENNLKISKLFKRFNSLKNNEKPNNDKDQIKDRWLKISPFSKMLKSFKKLSLGSGNEKSTSSMVAPLGKVDESTTKKKGNYTIEIVKIEECENKSDIESNASKSKNNFGNDNVIKILNNFDSIDEFGFINWSKIRTGSVDKVSNNSMTTPPKNEVETQDKGNLENKNSKTYSYTKHYNQFKNNEQEDKKEIKLVSFNERELNYSDLNKSTTEFSRGKDYKYDYESASDSDDIENTSDEEIIARGPSRICKNKGSSRVKPTKRKVKETVEENKYEKFLEYCKVSKEIDSLIEGLLNNQEKTKESNNFEGVFERPTRDTVTPESGYSSPGLQFNDLLAENEIVEEFLNETQNYVHDSFECNTTAPNALPNSNSTSKSNKPELEKFCIPLQCKDFRTIASKDQQTSNSVLRNQARNKLFSSADFCKNKCYKECRQIYEQIEAGEIGTSKKEIIHYLDGNKGKNSYRRMNLHDAVEEENLEKCFAIIEIHKQRYGSICFWINNGGSDINKKTVLDCAKEKENSVKKELLIKYLEENYAKPSQYT